jgi:hypothetical protein
VVRMRPGEEATIGTLVNMAGSSNLVMAIFLLLSLEQNYFYFRVSSSNQVGIQSEGLGQGIFKYML